MTKAAHDHLNHVEACSRPTIYGHRGEGCLDVDDAAGCAAYDAALPSAPGALLLGERLNVSSEYQRTTWGLSARRKPYEFLTQPGSFLWGMARRRLLKCSVRWGASANLLWPAAKGLWDAAAAKEWAAMLCADPAFRAHRVVWICGRRPAEALGLTEWAPLQILVPTGSINNQVWVTLPHPSGTSRFWNDPDAEKRVRDFVLSVYEYLRTTAAA